ncbi:MAG TPA: tRNA lysidine(34) synthetase TilS [Magnetospirillaceae bacterium]|nr:tRNA lysidine(34) synthetase TilS [Magnetospirillaceae bacterium]
MIDIAPGRYIVAVSGGVDSMVLIEKLRRMSGLDLVVAHANHGQRPDAQLDASLVAEYCRKRSLIFISEKLSLPPAASEAEARAKRWEFLRRCIKKYNAQAIVTAHHQDDLIETALIALFRGTGWRGLAPFVGATDILRPLLSHTKNDIIAYARRHNIAWREDSTNQDETYLRNYIRHTFIPTLDQKRKSWRTEFLQHIRKQQALRHTITENLDAWLDRHDTKNNTLTIPRYELIMAPDPLAYEYVQHIFWRHTTHTLERRQAEAAVLFTKVAQPGKLMQMNKHWQLRAESANVIVEPRTTVLSLNKH